VTTAEHRTPTDDAQAGTPEATARHEWLSRLATAALVGWGALHVVGGVALVVVSRQGATDALGALGTAVTVAGEQAPTGDAARVAAAVVGFHGFDVAAAGVAVLALAVLGHRHRRRDALGGALVIATVLDVGLTAFLLLPGLMSLTDGLAGLALLAAALVTVAAAARRGRRR
jgi:hypothetical protein